MDTFIDDRPGSGALTREQLEQFHRDGFAGPFDSGLSADRIDAMRAQVLDFIENMTDHPLYGRFSVRDWHLVYPELADLIHDPTVVAKLRQIMGPDLTMWRSKVFHKRPGDGPIEWHQEWGAFNGEEIGNDKPSLVPHSRLTRSDSAYWNTTIWFALDDVGMDKGPLQMIRGSYRKRYPIDMIPMVDSAFWADPFLDIHDKHTLVDRCQRSLLVLDMDTSTILDGFDVESRSFDQIKEMILAYFRKRRAAITLPFDIGDDELETFPVRKGQYIIFPERTMHRSIANTTASEHRVALNFRVTYSDTLIYPGRLQGDYIDGSNLDIRPHRCTLLSGENKNPQNMY